MKAWMEDMTVLIGLPCLSLALMRDIQDFHKQILNLPVLNYNRKVENWHVFKYYSVGIHMFFFILASIIESNAHGEINFVFELGECAKLQKKKSSMQKFF